MRTVEPVAGHPRSDRAARRRAPWAARPGCRRGVVSTSSAADRDAASRTASDSSRLPSRRCRRHGGARRARRVSDRTSSALVEGRPDARRCRDRRGRRRRRSPCSAARPATCSRSSDGGRAAAPATAPAASRRHVVGPRLAASARPARACSVAVNGAVRRTLHRAPRPTVTSRASWTGRRRRPAPRRARRRSSRASTSAKLRGSCASAAAAAVHVARRAGRPAPCSRAGGDADGRAARPLDQRRHVGHAPSPQRASRTSSSVTRSTPGDTWKPRMLRPRSRRTRLASPREGAGPVRQRSLVHAGRHRPDGRRRRLRGRYGGVSRTQTRGHDRTSARYSGAPLAGQRAARSGQAHRTTVSRAALRAVEMTPTRPKGSGRVGGLVTVAALTSVDQRSISGRDRGRGRPRRAPRPRASRRSASRS